MKILKRILPFFSLIIVIASCNKQNFQLAQNYYEQSLIELDNDNLKKSLLLINESIKHSPSNHYLALKATILYQLKNFSESLTLFKKIINNKDINPNFKCDIMNNYACLINQLGRKKEAEEIWSSLSADSNYLTPEVAFFNLGLLHFSNKNFEAALKNFKAAVEISEDYLDALFYLALVYKKLNDIDKSKKIILKILEISPDYKLAKELIR